MSPAANNIPDKPSDKIPSGSGLFFAGCLLAALLLPGGCAWFGTSQEAEVLRTGSTPMIVIPEGLDEPVFVDIMPIPEVVDYRNLAESDIEIGLPDALTTRFGVEQIVIRKLGDIQWVFIDRPTALVWPEVVRYFEENEVPVAELDPRNGVLETEWVEAAGETAETMFASIIDAGVVEESTINSRLNPSQHRFRVRVEPGVRSGSTELHAQHRRLPTGAPFRLTDVDWSGDSDDKQMENEALSALAYYMGDQAAEDPSVSLLAGGLEQRESKAALEPQADGMVLKYKLGFDRAWATVGAALENARIDVEDLDRSSSNYYVHYTRQHDPDPGFFSRLFSSDDDKLGSVNRFTIHLEPVGEETHVTVLAGIPGDAEAEAEAASGSTPNMDTLTLLLTERLLKLIKEYST